MLWSVVNKVKFKIFFKINLGLPPKRIDMGFVYYIDTYHPSTGGPMSPLHSPTIGEPGSQL